MTQRTDVSVDLYSDEEGLYDVVVQTPEGRYIVDPRMVTEHVERSSKQGVRERRRPHVGKLHDEAGSAIERGKEFNKDLYYHLTMDHGHSFTAAELQAETHDTANERFLRLHHEDHQ